MTDPCLTGNDLALYQAMAAQMAAETADRAAAHAPVLEYFHTEMAAPRDQDLALAHLARLPLQGRVWIYGGGSFTRAVLPHLRARTDIQLEGIVDRNSRWVVTDSGLPVIAPTQLTTREFDHVLVAHVSREPDMVEALTENGVPATKIVRLFGNPDFAAAALAARSAETCSQAAALAPDYLILDTTGMSWQLIPDADLARLLPPERSLKLFLGRQEHYADHGIYPTLDLKQSASLAAEVMRTLRPKTVYLRTTCQLNGDGYPVLIREAAPDAVLIHEIYDVAMTFPGPYLAEGWGYSDLTERLARAGTACSFREAGYVLYKSGGSPWEPFRRLIEVPNGLYYPLREDIPSGSPAPAPEGNEPFSILYAGSIHTRSKFTADSAFKWADVVPFFRQLAAEGHARVEMFNGLHRGSGGDADYAEYLDEFASGPIRYHRAIPLAELVGRMSAHHYGWVAFHRPDPAAIPLIDKITTHNKLTSYLLGGLPVIVTDYFTHVAELVRDFDAGLVVTSDEIAGIGSRLNATDYRRHVAGAKRLREHMIAANRNLFADLAKALPRP